jgi:hypothetical protein
MGVICHLVSITTWQLRLGALALTGRHIANPADPQIFPSVFGMVLTVLIALEFKHTLLVVKASSTGRRPGPSRPH